jgi:hypothetical protein
MEMKVRRGGVTSIAQISEYFTSLDALAHGHHWLEVHQLPPYSPELNPTERLWQHTRKNGTHNRFFGGLDALLATLTRVFGEMQSHPQLIRSYLMPFVDRYVPLFMRGCIDETRLDEACCSGLAIPIYVDRRHREHDIRTKTTSVSLFQSRRAAKMFRAQRA